MHEGDILLFEGLGKAGSRKPQGGASENRIAVETCREVLKTPSRGVGIVLRNSTESMDGRSNSRVCPQATIMTTTCNGLHLGRQSCGGL